MLAICLTLIDDENDKITFRKIYDTYERRLFAYSISIFHNTALSEEAVIPLVCVSGWDLYRLLWKIRKYLYLTSRSMDVTRTALRKCVNIFYHTRNRARQYLFVHIRQRTSRCCAIRCMKWTKGVLKLYDESGVYFGLICILTKFFLNCQVSKSYSAILSESQLFSTFLPLFLPALLFFQNKFSNIVPLRNFSISLSNIRVNIIPLTTAFKFILEG